MPYYIVGLGNPGEQYEKTRHNTGRIVLEYCREKLSLSLWEFDKKIQARVSRGGIGKEKVLFIEPETFMNKSGISIRGLIANKKKAEKLIVVHDDLDLPIGTFKISFNMGTAGHRGVESLIKVLKTRCFVRIRVGIAPTISSGKTKKPHGKEKVINFILGNFTPSETKKIRIVSKKICEAISVVVSQNRGVAMNMFN